MTVDKETFLPTGTRVQVREIDVPGSPYSGVIEAIDSKAAHPYKVRCDGDFVQWVCEEEIATAENLPVEPDRGMKYDGGKPRYSLLAPGFARAVIEVLEYGAQKYAPRSWQGVPDAVERYTDAMWRHYDYWLADKEDRDQESGLHHLAHVACNAMFLWWFSRHRPQLVEEFRRKYHSEDGEK